MGILVEFRKVARVRRCQVAGCGRAKEGGVDSKSSRGGEDEWPNWKELLEVPRQYGSGRYEVGRGRVVEM